MEKENQSVIYWSLLKQEEWNFHLAATSKGLCYVGSQNKPYQELSDWADKRFPSSLLVHEDEKIEPYMEEFIGYLQGKRQNFTKPIDYSGTLFQIAVWKALREIPYGKTLTYSEIATAINKPAAVRAVGTAIGANPILISVPCHRVIGKNGSLTGYRGGLDMKTQLLQLESKSS